MKTSIVPELLNSNGIEIFDDNNVKIKICVESEFILSGKYFKRPYIIIDNMETKKYQHIEIKRISFSDLERFKMKLLSIDLRSSSRRNMKNRPGQQKCYILKEKNSPHEGGTELFKLPKDHLLELDLTNKRIRLRGNNCYPYIKNENASKWVEIKNE